MEGDQIGEVRGIAEEQNLDPYITDTVEEKLDQFPDGDKYRKKVADMEKLTKIEEKVSHSRELTRDELIFLYEIEEKIEGFGYQRDPRIEELRDKRDPKEDAPVVLDLKPDEIAWGRKEIDDDTKAYIGPLFEGFFDKYSDIEHIYTSFPKEPIRREELEIGGKTAQQLEEELKEKGIKITDYAEDMLHSSNFNPQANREEVSTVRLRVANLGLTGRPTTDQIYTRAQELGLKLCPAEVGPHKRLEDTNQPAGDYYRIAMEPIADRDGNPHVFCLLHVADGLWLDDYWAYPVSGWDPENSFLFCLRKSS